MRAIAIAKGYEVQFIHVMCSSGGHVRLRWHDIKGWEKVVLWFDGIREPAEGSNYW